MRCIFGYCYKYTRATYDWFCGPGSHIILGKLPQHFLRSLFVWQAAQHTQKQSTELFQCLYFRDKDSNTDERCVADAVIYAVRANGFLAFVPQ